MEIYNHCQYLHIAKKNLLIDFLIWFIIFIYWKGKNFYDLIFVIIDWLTKMIYYK